MQEPFVGQITLYAFGYAPQGWAFCDGATMQAQQNQALFSLLGNYFGGDLKTYFKLPDLRGRAPVAVDFNTVMIGQSAGSNTLTVPAAALPQHNHSFNALSSSPTQLSPAGGVLATMPSNGTPPITGLYTTASTTQASMAAAMVSPIGGAAADNRQPSLALNFCIATTGYYPPRD